MKFIKMLWICIFVILLILQQQILLALSPSEIEDIAKTITVKVKRIEDSPNDVTTVGSGTIVCYNTLESKYYILTNYHVAGPGNKYLVETFDGNQYAINDILKLPNVDLVLLSFQSKSMYNLPEFANSDLLTLGKIIYIYGWPNSSSVPKLVSGQFRVHNLQDDGYDLFYANAKTQRGMSGGPILDENGRLVGIHGQANTFYQGGISINTFLNPPLVIQKKYPQVNYLELCYKTTPKEDTNLAFNYSFNKINSEY